MPPTKNQGRNNVMNTEKMLAEIKDAHILITDQKISNMKDLVPLLEQLLQA